MDLIQLEIIGISYSQTQTGAYALILSEIIGKRKLPIVIGGFEAQSIAMGIENEITPPRPLTHDLFKNVLIFNKKNNFFFTVGCKYGYFDDMVFLWTSFK